jgi:hypothetical protein
LKKGSFIFLALFLIGGILLCTNLYLNRKKPNNYYYTNLLAKNLTLNEDVNVRVLDTNFYKTESFNNEDIESIKSFLKELRKPNFISKPVFLTQKPEYKIFFDFTKINEKYVINIYNNEYISVQPWDGDFSMDYINMKNISPRYNLYSLGKNAFVKEPNFK